MVQQLPMEIKKLIVLFHSGAVDEKIFRQRLNGVVSRHFSGASAQEVYNRAVKMAMPFTSPYKKKVVKKKIKVVRVKHRFPRK